jgi:anti-sigma regulatory factor (Ser/Thr protein kinase)
MVEWSFDTRDANATRSARIDFAKHINRRFGSPAAAMSAELVLGELIGNVVRYAPGPARVRASFDERGVTIAVHDAGNGFSPRPQSSETNLLTESGRGLAIVSRLARSIEIDCAENDGCCVRARLDVVSAN